MHDTERFKNLIRKINALKHTISQLEAENMRLQTETTTLKAEIRANKARKK